MLVNRVGDLGLALAISLIFFIFKAVDYPLVFAMTPEAINNDLGFLSFKVDALSIVSFLIFWGALGKSAQIGLHI